MYGILSISLIYLIFSSLYVHSFVRLLVHGIKNMHLVGRRNDVTTNMAILAVCMCLAVSHLLDTSSSSVWVSQARHALAQTFTVIIWCSTWVFLFCYMGTLAVSAPGC